VNQPLHTISNYTSAISSALATADGQVQLDKIRKWNDDISKAVVRAADIIKRIRAYLSKNSTQRTSVNLNLLLEESVELMSFEARRLRAVVHLELQRPSPWVLVDSIAIQQVAVNLLRNAFEAMEKTTASDRVVTIRTSIRDGIAEVEVSDRGAGISDEVMSRLFATFNTSKPNGMGMGLAISKTIIEAHHGEIWATRNAKRGSTFHFTLPLVDEPKKGKQRGQEAAEISRRTAG
jgi:two-component system sensor kinase FixL